jgi:hypothetical protein
MSSAFDSETYAERQRLPGVAINLPRLMQHALHCGIDPQTVTLSLEYRPDVDTCSWWTLRWGDQFAAAKELELCLFRAAVMMRRADERSKKYAGQTDKGENHPPAD